MNPLWLLKIELSQYSPDGILYDIQRLYERTHKQKYKAELDYIFNLAIEDSKINLETVITQFAQGLREPNEQLRGTEQERGQFFYVVYLAMRCYQTVVIDRLLAKGFRVDEAVVYDVARHWKLIDPNSILSPRKHLHIMNMLDMAIETHSFEMINYLISKDANINVTAEPHSTSLELEVQKLANDDRFDTDILQFLLKCPGANPNLPSNETGFTPLHRAAWTKVDPQIVQLLIDHRADVNLRLQSGHFPKLHGRVPLYYTRNYDTAKKLIENKADVNAEYGVGFTPIYSMIYGVVSQLEKQGNPQVYIDIAGLLCRSGADVNKRLSNGKTLLQMTADASLRMTGRTAKQKLLKELFTVLQTTKPDQQKMEKETSPMETKTISSGWSWMNPFNWRTDTEIQRLEKKVNTSKGTQPQNMDNSFFGSMI